MNHLWASGAKWPIHWLLLNFKFIMQLGCFLFITSKTSNTWLITSYQLYSTMLKEIFVILQTCADLIFHIKISSFCQSSIFLTKIAETSNTKITIKTKLNITLLYGTLMSKSIGVSLTIILGATITTITNPIFFGTPCTCYTYQLRL